MVKYFKLLSLVSLLFLLGLPLQAQTVMTGTAKTEGFQVADPGFENWTQQFNGQPALGGGSTGANTGKGLWYGANVFKDVGVKVYGQVVHKESGRLGGSAAKLVDTEVGALGITETSPSWITLGTPWSYVKGIDTGSATAGTDGGVKFTARPDTMAVWIKRDASKGTENINLVYYSWKGTAKGNKYKNKNGGCESTGEHINEESDIRLQTDANDCGSYGNGMQIGEGHFQTTTQYKNWTLIKVPIKYYKDDVPEMMNIILSASNYPEGRRNDGLHNGNYLIVDDLSLIYSSKIHEIRLDNEPMQGFNPNINSYTIELGEHATIEDIPSIICKRSGRVLTGNEISITYPTEIGAPATIVVKAEDGSSITTYTLNFVRKRSTNSNLNNIFVNGEPIPSFSGFLTNYSVEVPYGSKEEPVITVDKGDVGQTIQVVSCNNFPCKAQVIVTAANPNYSTTYNLDFKEGQLKDNTLQDILVNGNSIPGFKPETNTYQVELPLGTTATPTIEAVSKYAEGDQNIVITNGGLNGRSTIVVTPPTGSPRTYRITFVITESSYSYLKDIQVGGVSLPDFNAEKTQYEVKLPLGTTKLPAITWTQGDPYQTVSVTDEGVNGTARITVKSQKGNSTIYRINFSVEKSTVTTLNNIFVNGTSLQGFAPDTYDYTYNVTGDVTTRPVVTWETADAYQIVTKNPTSESTVSLEGVTKLTVRAQDGSTAVYSITFTQKLSDNASLADLKVAGYELTPAFSPETTEYICKLGRGTTTVPAITFTKGDATQVVRVDEKGVNGVATITVKAQTGTTQVYSISFSVETSSDATLKDILVGGKSVDGFSPNTFEYNVTLPSGTTVLPNIEAVKNDAAQRVAMIKGGVNGTTEIKVVAEEGAELIYKLNFSVEKSLNANLKNIYVGGNPLADFTPDVMMYRYVLAENMSSCPIVKAEGYPGQTITTTMPKLVGVARIEVQPEIGNANIYTIEFVREMSSNNKLANMMVNGKDFGFSPDVNEYTITLPEGTMVVPTVTFSKGEEKQTVQKISGGLNGTTQVVVIAEDGTSNVYEIHFSVAKSAQVQLKGIYLEDQLLADFNPAVLEYTYILPYGTTTLPTVTYQSQEGQHVSLLLPQLEGDATFVVTAEDGSSATYKVDFQLAKLENATLQNIFLDGVSIANFDANTFEYTVDYVKGAALPAITFQKADATQQVVVNNQGLQGCTLTVTAQNGNQQVYRISYNVLNNQNALLNDIQLYNIQSSAFTSVEDFQSNKLQYNVVLPWRTTELPLIKPVPASKGQVITIEEGGVNGTTTITVLADDATTTATYTINFSVEQSNDATLSNILVNDNDMPGFDPAVFDYEVSVPYGTTTMPNVTFENAYKDGKAITEQQVVVTDGGLYGVTTLQVTSQDGSATNTYKLTFTIEPTDKPNTLQSIIAGKVEVPLMDGLYTYNITLPYGTTEMPDLTIVKNYPEQEVQVIKQGTAFGYRYSVTVLPNMPNVGPTLYHINCQIDKSPTVLTGINVKNNAKLFPSFKSDVTQYVAHVKDKSDLEFLINEDKNKITYPEAEQATNKIVAVVTSLDDKTATRKYTVYLHYVDDIIPNGDFTDWSKAKFNNADKPTGWKVPADSKGTYAWTVNTGHEVIKADNSNSIVGFRTAYWGALGGTIPPVMTLGNLDLSFGVAASSKVSVSGGITFRNSPDYAKISYNYKEKAKKEHRALFAFSFDNVPCNFVSDKTSGSVEYTHPLNVSGKSPKQMNITIDATNTFESWAASGDYLDVDYIKFVYNSEIKSVKINGTVATKSGNTFSVTIDPEYVGFPQLEITGAVADQAYDVVWNSEIDHVRTGTIRSFAEDGSYTEYKLSVTRPVSDNNQLKELKINGHDFGFNPAENNYTIYLPVSVRQLPNITVEPQSHYAMVNITSVNILNADVASQNNKSTYVITVTSEKGGNNMYTIVVDKEYSNDATLKGIEVAGYDINFTPDVDTYTVVLPAGTTEWPTVTYQKQTEEQVVTLNMGATTTLLVTANDGTTTKTYTINFVVEPTATSAQLQDLRVLSDDLALDQPFNKDTYNYVCKVSGNEVPTFFYQSEFADDALNVVQSDDEIIITLTQNTLQRSLLTNIYTVKIEREVSTNASLETILVNGSPVDKFAADVYTYEVTTQEGVVYDIQPVLAEEGQTMIVEFDEATQTYNIVVKAADATTSQTYTVKLVAPINNNANLASILIGDKKLPGFDPAETKYTYTIPCVMPKWEEPLMPHIQAIGASKDQTISIENNGINGNTYINVTPQSGPTKTYEIAFEAQKSDYVYLKNIFKNCVALDEFFKDLGVYEYDIPVTEQRPVISYEAGDAFQVIDEDNDEDKHVITVTAQSGDTYTYTIYFNRTYAKNALLNGITLDGVLLDKFASDDLEYDVELPVGTTVLPMIGVINGADGQTTKVVTNGVNGDAVITVTADDNTTIQDYTIHFTVDKSQVNTLLDIQLDGVSIEGFDPTRYEYNHTMPVGNRVWPLVSYTAGDAYQTVEMTENEVDTWNKVVTLVAKPEDEEIKSKTYTITLNVEKSSLTALKDIQLNNVSIEGYNADTIKYVIELPIGTKEYPEVTYTLGDEFQVVDQHEDGNKVTLTVTAEDSSVRVYTLEFVILHSSNANLSSISVNNEVLEDFKPERLSYNYELPYGTTEMPIVTYESGDMWQQVSVIDGGVNGDYIINVVAEDGYTTLSYVIHFSVALSNNALLTDIIIGEESLNDFDPEVYNYTYDLPYGVTEIPTVTVASTEGQTVEIVNATSLDEVTTITITAEDAKTVKVYTITWGNKKSSNAQLNMIYLDGVAMQDFNPENSDYPISLPYGTTEMPVITWEAGDADQTVTLEWNDQTAFIAVEAQDGTPGEYVITFTIEKSSENRLKDLAINGVTVENFDPEVVEYKIVYPAGTPVENVATIDQISYQVFNESEEVSFIENGMVLMVQVKAENGDVRTYVIAQSIALSNNTLLEDIMIEGKSLDSFDPKVLEYTYILPYGSAVVPSDITYVSSDTTQTVSVSINPLGEPTEIFVTAENGDKAVYKIHFSVDDYDPSSIPTEENVCVTLMPDGQWRFTTDCNNVTLYLVTVDGKFILSAALPLVDVNVPNICDLAAEGFTYRGGECQVIAYYFLHNNKKVISRGKFRTSINQ